MVGDARRLLESGSIDPQQRADAADILVAQGDPDIVPVLKAWLDGDHAYLRQRALQALLGALYLAEYLDLALEWLPGGAFADPLDDASAMVRAACALGGFVLETGTHRQRISEALARAYVDMPGADAQEICYSSIAFATNTSCYGDEVREAVIRALLQPDTPNDEAQAIARVQEYLTDVLGNPDFPLLAEFVPEPLRDLIPLAEQFGIGDDGTRETAIELMPDSFVARARELVASKQDFLDAWLSEGEWTEERNAFAALRQALDWHTPDKAFVTRIHMRLR
jgi:hypothetical protein